LVEIIKERMSAEADGDFVVFLIGVRVNKFWKMHKFVAYIGWYRLYGGKSA